MPHTQGKVLLQFGATWCQPCRTMAPIAQQIAEENKITYIKVDAEEQPELANEYNVRGVPSFLVLDNGQELGRFNGSSVRSLSQLVKACLS